MRLLVHNILWGSRWGLFCGVIYVGYAAVIVFLKGGFAEAPPGVTPITLFGTYLGGGLAAGAIVGLCRPLLGTRPRATVVGMIAAVPAVMCFAILQLGPVSSWGTFGWVVTAFTSILLGGMGGFIFHGILHEPAVTGSDQSHTTKSARRRSRKQSRSSVHDHE